MDSCFNQSQSFEQVCLVDNDSRDQSLSLLANYPQVKILAQEMNKGYAAGANLGIRQVLSSDLILVANSDIFLDRDFNTRVLERFQNSDIDILAPLILRFDQKTVDSAGQTYSWALYPREIGFNQPIHSNFLKERSCFSACGAATVFRTQALQKLKIGEDFYDEEFFTFWEDFDLGWRASLLGLRLIFCPQVKVFHFRSGTLKRSFVSRFSLSLARSPEIKFHLIKNRYLTLIKNFRWNQFWWTIPWMILRDILWVGLLTISAPKIIIPLVKSGKYLKSALKKRSIIQQHE